MLAAEFLETNYEKVFENYQKLLHSDNYVTRRQSLKLLGELLLDRHNFSVMTRYISNPGMSRNLYYSSLKAVFSSYEFCNILVPLLGFNAYSIYLKSSNAPDNLKLMMNMLKEKARNIQFEAFHVFKVAI